MKYFTIPTPETFRRDSSVFLAFRSSDPVLSRIDVLLDNFHKFRNRKPVVCDLYFTARYWIESVRKNNKEMGRQPAMEALYELVTRQLCAIFHCQPSMLQHELGSMFGRDLSSNGIAVDFNHKKAHYMPNRHSIEQYRIWFKAGLAYQQCWWDSSNRKPERRLVDSSNAYNPDGFVQAPGKLSSEGYGPFVLTMGREFYMNMHKPGTKANAKDGFYHSSYLAGEPVMAAGSMLIVNGRVMRIRPDSGHYKPTDTNTMAVLWALKAVGVSLASVMVENFNGTASICAKEFCSGNARWKLMKDSRADNVKNMIDSKEELRMLREIQALGNSVPVRENEKELENEEKIAYA